jgi:mRNA interferase HigB
MVIAGRDKLQKLAKKHGDARGPLGAWIREVEAAAWRRMADVKARYPNASILSGNRVVFEIKGNRYRVLAQIAFGTQRVTWNSASSGRRRTTPRRSPRWSA